MTEGMSTRHTEPTASPPASAPVPDLGGPAAAGAAPGPARHVPPVVDPAARPVPTAAAADAASGGSAGAAGAADRVAPVAGAASGGTAGSDDTASGDGAANADLRARFNEVTSGLAPHVAAATEKTRDAAGKAAEVVRDKVIQTPALASAAGRTVEAKDRAVGTVREQLDQHPQVAAAAERTAASGGKAARSAGQQARRHPGATGGAVFGAAALLFLRRVTRRRKAARNAQ
ncbi:hypothetical protein [Parafrankia sp. FMc2]|uniref:hypothetical protein n=1 Tax=Parafrankia sp. FMc2 TaxID=3233196 RepID=UPI0034D6EE29